MIPVAYYECPVIYVRLTAEDKWGNSLRRAMTIAVGAQPFGRFEKDQPTGWMFLCRRRPLGDQPDDVRPAQVGG